MNPNLKTTMLIASSIAVGMGARKMDSAALAKFDFTKSYLTVLFISSGFVTLATAFMMRDLRERFNLPF